MVYSSKEKINFYQALESLKRYRRAELKDQQGRSLLKKLYVDLLPDDFILTKSIQPNTTYLVGRKGTGKSTIFLRIEEELNEKNSVVPVYLDAKTVFESSQNNLLALDNNSIATEYYKKYVWQYNFIKSFLGVLFEKIEKNYKSKRNLASFFLGDVDKDYVETELNNMKRDLETDGCFSILPFPIFEEKIKEITLSDSEEVVSKGPSASMSLNFVDQQIGGKIESGSSQITEAKHEKINEKVASVLLQDFNIQDIISKIKNILLRIKINHIFILLDDFSELDDDSIKYFTDVIIAPLNNWSEEFIKFKVAAYPNRIYYGKIDSTKVDLIDLDFYKLYSSHNRDDMESLAINFTERLLKARFRYYLKNDGENFFDTSKTSMDEYYELIFQTSFNVPRIMGYILVNCYETHIVHNKPITKQAIKNACEKYYEDKLSVYFNKTIYSLVSIEEKINTFQLKRLIELFISRAKEIKNKILKKEFTGKNYSVTEPCSSHFFIDKRYEEYIKTLELNFFVNKYGELKDRDRRSVSIYALNYGLCENNSIIFGSPKSAITQRKYFIERPFNNNKIISDFLTSLTKVICTGCNKEYSQDDLPFLKWNNFKCNECSGIVEEVEIDNGIRSKIAQIEEADVLPVEELDIMKELAHTNEPISAKDLSVEIDLSSQLIAQRARKLATNQELIVRNKPQGQATYVYSLSEKGTKYLKKIFSNY